MSTQPPPTPPDAGLPVASVDETPSVRGARRTLVGAIVALVVLMLVSVVVFGGRAPTASHYIGLSLLLFATGAVGVLVRRNALVLFMCIELMLNAVNIAFVAFSRSHNAIEGQVVVLFVMIVAAAEVAVGLAIIVSIFRRRGSANVDDLSLLRW